MHKDLLLKNVHNVNSLQWKLGLYFLVAINKFMECQC